MAKSPDAVEQVLHMHAPFIHAVVNALNDRQQLPMLMQMLATAEQQGWAPLVRALRQVVDGKRDESIKLGLDDEDRIVVDAVLRGLANPASLPPINKKIDAGVAAPGLASMINASAHGDAQALAVLANMAEQMVRAGGDMARLGGIMRRLVNGERDFDRLSLGMGAKGRGLLQDILSELAKSTLH